MVTELFGLQLVCRHETYPVTIFHITFYFSGCVCEVLQIGYTSVAGFSSRITEVTTISVLVGFVVETGTSPPNHPINSVCPPQYHSQLICYVQPTYHKSYTISWYWTSFLLSACVSRHQFLWGHKTPDWCRSQLRCLVIRGLDKSSEMTVSKDAYSMLRLVAALPHKVEGRGFHSRWGRWIFYWLNPPGRTMAMGSTQLLTELSTRDISWGVNAAGAQG
jgi:hypothetical protein